MRRIPSVQLYPPLHVRFWWWIKMTAYVWAWRIHKFFVKPFAFLWVKIEAGDYYTGNGGRYFERVGGSKPTINGPNSYLLKVESAKLFRCTYISSVAVWNEELKCSEFESRNNGQPRDASIAELKYEIFCGYLQKPVTMDKVKDAKWTADAEL